MLSYTQLYFDFALDLPPLERYIQHYLIKLIDTFSTIAIQLDQLGKLDEYRSMWSDAHNEAFKQIIESYSWE
jgi:hypothetical protein